MTAADPPYAGAVLIADTSARVRTHLPGLREEWDAAVKADQIVTCSMVTMELLFGAPDMDSVTQTQKIEATLRQARVTASVQRAAIGAVGEPARRACQPARKACTSPGGSAAGAAARRSRRCSSSGSVPL